MSTLSATIHPFRVPLSPPLVLAGRTYAARSGVLLRVERGGIVGWGEAAPLPGFSPDTLEMARDALQRITATATALARSCRAVERDRSLSDLYRQAPAAQAAVEGALLSLVAQERGTTVARLLNPEAAPVVEINGLLTAGPLEEVLARAHQLRDAGYRAVKLKVGTAPVEEEARLVRAVANVIGPRVALRLDANRAWSRAEALDFALRIAGVPIAYIEEPVSDPRDLPAVAEHLPVALDESLVGQSPALLGACGYAHAVVLKPMLLGGVATAWRWAEAARRRGMVPVVSAAFETGIGLRLNVALAAALGGTPPAGLDTYRWMARDVLPASLPLDGPTVAIVELGRDALLRPQLT